MDYMECDEEMFGGLFDTGESVPEYPIKNFVIDRRAIVHEGRTNAGFLPLRDCFGRCGRFSWGSSETQYSVAPITRLGFAAVSTAAEQDGEANGEKRPTLVTESSSADQKPDIVVHYRDKLHSLWGHRLWNAAKYLVKRMDMKWIDVRGKTVLELGAGLGVPSIAAFHNGARLCVVTDYPDTDLIRILEQNVRVNCEAVVAREVERGADGSLSSKHTGPDGRMAVVEPLLWGNAEQIRKVMGYTAQVGFDVVILSDILFNHVCNDDLADTLVKTLKHSPESIAYCVFSHHRARKQLHDLEFFDQCTARGLDCVQIDEEDYPLMFPEDHGPVEVRKPVKCYVIKHRYDAAGPALDAQSTFDVCIQGTGMVQAYLSAALSRSGLRVLHCDGQSDYGGAHQTVSLLELRNKLRRHPGTIECPDRASSTPEMEDAYGKTSSMPCTTASPAGVRTPVILVDRLFDELQKQQSVSASSPDAQRALDLRQILVDILPTTYLSNGTTIQELVRSGMAQTMEFQNASAFVFLQPSTRNLSHRQLLSTEKPLVADRAVMGFEARTAPLTRSAVFVTSDLSLTEKRRVMKFVKDVMPPLAEKLHAQCASPADDEKIQQAAATEVTRKANELFVKKAVNHPGLDFSTLLTKKYGLSQKAYDIVTLMGEVDLSRAPLGNAAASTASDPTKLAHGILRSVELFRQIATSVGLYGGSTPFLQPLFGASEMVQYFCRSSAVWGGVFVLNRSLRYIGVNRKKKRQYAVLSNGQWISAKIIVAPREILPTDPEGGLPVYYQDDWQEVLGRARKIQVPASNSPSHRATKVKAVKSDIQWSRLVLVLRKPPLTWAHISDPSDDSNKNCDNEIPPSVVGLMRAFPDLQANDAQRIADQMPVVHFTQHSHSTNQAPCGSTVILHFTADAAVLPQAKLEAFVMKHFCAKHKNKDGDKLFPQHESQTGSLLPQVRFQEDDVLFCASFTLSAVQAALDGLQVPEPYAAIDKPSETRHAHPYAIQESLKLQSAIEKSRERLLREDDPERRERSDRSAGPEIVTSERTSNTAPSEEDTSVAEHVRVVSLPTLLPGLLNDSQYMEEARTAYQRVVDLLVQLNDGAKKNYVFLERFPTNSE